MSKESTNKSQVSKKPQTYNLKFLDLFLKKMKWSIPEFADKVDMTKAAVYHWFKVDDMQLTTLHNAFDKIGYEVIFSMEMPNMDDNIKIEIDPKDDIDTKPRKRLNFLRSALYDNDIDQNRLARKLGIDVETIDYWFRHDKCYISYFFRIAKFTGMKLKVDIRPVKKEDFLHK